MQLNDLPEISDKRVDMALTAVNKAYEPLPETTCKSLACCCKVACPNMVFSEFLNIYKNFVLKMSREERLDLTIECVKSYLINQGPVIIEKPCVFLSKTNMCNVYDARPLKCRTYGIIPHNLYKKIVDRVSIDTGINARDIPLCVQCPFVKIKPEFADRFPNGKLPENMIKEIEMELKAIDNTLMGVSSEAQEKGFGFLVYHDWHLIFEMGTGWLEKLTPIRLKFSQKQKDDFVESLRKLLQAQLLSKPETIVESQEIKKNE